METKLNSGKGKGRSCINCRHLHTTSCPHAMWISGLDITKHHCSKFKRASANASRVSSFPVRVFS